MSNVEGSNLTAPLIKNECPPEYNRYQSQPQPGYMRPQQPNYMGAPYDAITSQPTSNLQTIGTPYKDYLVSAILVTLCCFWPVGIFAIVKAVEARSAMDRGDIVAASSSSRTARILVIVSLVVGIITLIVCSITVAISMSVSANNTAP